MCRDISSFMKNVRRSVKSAAGDDDDTSSDDPEPKPKAKVHDGLM